MKIKKILAAAAAAAMLFSAAACSGGSSGTEKKTLKVGCEAPYEPFEYYDENDKLVGVDIELAEELGKRLGYNIEFVFTEFDMIFDGLNSSEYDCIISAITITPDRLEGFLFSDSYIQNYQCIVALKDGKAEINSIDDIAGLRVGYQEGTTSEEFVNEYASTHGISFDSEKFAKLGNSFSELESGRIDAIVCDSTVASSFISGNSKFKQSWIQSSDPEEFAITFRKTDTELRDKVNSALSEIKKEGKLQAILDKYF